MKFRESEPDYENILKRAGWRIYVERETAMQGSRTYRRLILRATKISDKVKVSAEAEFEHGAWKELFELAQQLDSSLKLSNRDNP